METGFLNKHDSEYFCADEYEQSNGFESENSLSFNVFAVDYEDGTPESDEWIIPDEITTSDKSKIQFKEDFRKTFEDWQQHISSYAFQSQSVDEAPLPSPLAEELPDIYGTAISIPTERIKIESLFVHEDNLIDKTSGNIEHNDGQKYNINDELNTNKEMAIKTLLEIDKSHINDTNNIILDKISIKQEGVTEALKPATELPTYHAISVKVDPTVCIKEEMLSPFSDMPILSPVENDIKPKLEEHLLMQPPTLKISGNGNLMTDTDDSKMSTTDLGPDNYDVVEIKVEQDDEDNTVTLHSSVPDNKSAIEAPSLDRLLEQFEAAASVTNINNNSNNKYVPKLENNIKHKSSSTIKLRNKQSSTPTVPKISLQTNKTIKDALPREVINRIKDSSSRKKGISVVPAERLPAKGYNHMKDPGATKNKFTKLTTAKRGETVKLDHNYCNGIGGGMSVNGGEEANTSAVSTTARSSSLTGGGNTPSHSDHSSKKDSGLESGDVSDCSSEPSFTTVPTSAKSSARHCSLNKGSSKSAVHNTSEDNVVKIDIEVKPCNEIEESVTTKTESTPSVSSEQAVDNQGEKADEPKKKKKLNLEEYWSRRKNIKNKPVSPTKSFVKAEMNGFRKIPENTPTADESPATPIANTDVQTQLSDEKKEIRKRETSKDRRSSRPLQRYRRRTSSSSSSSSDSRSRSRWHRERSRRRYSKGRGPRSRSRSRSSSSGHSVSSSSSQRSRSRNRSSKYHYRSRTNYRRSNYTRHSRYSQERVTRRHEDWSPVEKVRQMEERRVIYVGQLEDGTTKSQLRERFETFGPIIDISLHFRMRGDNYGFVTFAYKVDAYKAVEHGNDYPLEPQYDICFGGRRAFCKQRYSDLDGLSQGYSPYHQNPRSNDSFDLLLREAQEKIRKQKHV